MEWQPIETAPKDQDILVWFDHEADPYQDHNNPEKLTDYAAWAECGEVLHGRGLCIAKWFQQQWEACDEYGGGFWMPPCWFAYYRNDYEVACNPTHWMPLPAPPEGK